MPQINTKIQDNPLRSEIASGFLGGLNSFQDETLIKDNELTEAKNVMLTIDGIQPRPGILHYGTAGTATKGLGVFAYYRSTGVREFLRVNNVSGELEKKNGAGWTTITGKTYSTSAYMNFVQARDRVYLFNGVDTLSFYNGTNITPYTSLATPVITSVIPQGTTGSTAYSYRVSAFNAVGETLASTPVAIANGNATLDVTNYNRLLWGVVAGAVGYNIYGRKSTGLTETLITTVYVLTWDDTGTLDPSLVVLPPLGNSTTGLIAKKGVFSQSRIFAAGDPSNPSRLSYGGIGSNIGNFSFSDIGGGATDIFLNDGAVIRDILPFQGGVIVWKDNAVYKFSFNSSGQPTVEEITRSFGGISFRGSRHVENDVIFPALKDGRLAFYSLGNQENYSAGILRTNELSVKVADDLVDVEPGELVNASTFYFNNIYGCAVARDGFAVNNRIWCLDTRFGAWTYWDDMKCNSFTKFSDSSLDENLYYADDATGFIEEMFQTARNDNGAAITGSIATKSFNQKEYKKIKYYYFPAFQFKDIENNVDIDVDVIINGAQAYETVPITLTPPNTGGAGVGVYLPGFHLTGDAPGGAVVSNVEVSDEIAELYLRRIEGRAIKYRLRFDTVNANFKLLALSHEYKILEGKRLDQSNRFYAS